MCEHADLRECGECVGAAIGVHVAIMWNSTCQLVCRCGVGVTWVLRGCGVGVTDRES